MRAIRASRSMYSGGIGSSEERISSALVTPRGLPPKYSRSTPGLEMGLKVGFPERSILPPTVWYRRPPSSSTHSTQRDRMCLGTWRMKASCAS
jgi:hypothetical protein